MGDEARKIVDVRSVKPYRSKGQKRQVLIGVFVAVMMGALGAGGYFLLMPKKQVYTLRDYETATVEQGDLVESTQASGTVQIPVQMSLPSPEEGYAATLRVSEGDTVVKGQLLARIDVPALRNSLEDLQSSLAEAERSAEKTAAQDKVDLGRKAREIAALALDIQAAEKERDRLEKLLTVGGARKTDVDAAQKTIDSLAASREEKQLQTEEDRQLYLLDEQAAQAKIADLHVQIGRLGDRIAAASITSPMNGEVLAVESSLGVPGSLITAGKALFTIADPKSAVVELEVLEQYSALIAGGQEVKLTVGSASLAGLITSIGNVAQQSSDGLGATVSVKVKPEESSAKLLLGNTAVGRIDLGTRKNVMLIPRGPYLTTGSQRYLYTIDGAAAHRVSVTFGATEGNTVEILTGVKPGDSVITSGYQNFIEYEEVSLVKGEKK